MSIFDRHPRPWVRSRGDIEDSTGGFVGFSVHYDDASIASAIVASVNAEPVLRARISALESCLRELRDAYVAIINKDAWGADAAFGARYLPEVERADALLSNPSAVPNSSKSPESSDGSL